MVPKNLASVTVGSMTACKTLFNISMTKVPLMNNPNQPIHDDLAPYFDGARLYGDDFNSEEIACWFRDEQEGYAELGAQDRTQYHYSYHALNRTHGYRWVPHGDFKDVLGLGSAYGDEFEPIADRIRRLTILEPSTAFRQSFRPDVPTEYAQPHASGTLPFTDGRFDLITSLGVLHHIPNVSHVVRELHRCLRPGGHVLIREPVVSMGDWRKPRRGLTKHERGIPYPLFQKIVREAGFKIVRDTLCVFPVLPLAVQAMGKSDPYNSTLLVALDRLLSLAFSWNMHYHARTTLQRFRPSSAYFVLTK